MSELIPVIPLAGGLSDVGELTGEISGVSEVIGGHISDDLLAANKYKGSYTVYPRKVAQTLDTSDKIMVNDLEVEAIRYSEITNPEGGYTVNIGFE